MNQIQITEYQNQRVLTTQQLAEAYGANTDTITKNFNRNKERYVVGKHFICLEGQALKDFKTNGQIDLSLKLNKLYLWTERGAFLHAKSLNTDKAWEVYDSLVEHYFQSQAAKPYMLPNNYKEALLQLVAQVEENEKLELENKALKPKAQFADAVSSSEDSVLVGDLAKMIKQNGYDIGSRRLFAWLRDKGYLIKRGKSKNLPTQKAMNMELFSIREQPYVDDWGENRISLKTEVTGKGQIYFINKFLEETGLRIQ